MLLRKDTSKYCCCFDMRRAVIILINLIDYVFVFFFLAGFYCSGEEESKEESDLSDDCTPLTLPLNSDSAFLACAFALKILLNGLGVYGAASFKIWPVALCLGGHICTSLFLKQQRLYTKCFSLLSSSWSQTWITPKLCSSS